MPWRSLSGSDTARAAAMAIAQTAANVVALVFTVIFARVLGADGYGSLAVLISAFIILMVPGSALQVAVSRELSTGLARGDAGVGSAVRRWLTRLALLGVGVALVAAVSRECARCAAQRRSGMGRGVGPGCRGDLGDGLRRARSAARLRGLCRGRRQHRRRVRRARRVRTGAGGRRPRRDRRIRRPRRGACRGGCCAHGSARPPPAACGRRAGDPQAARAARGRARPGGRTHPAVRAPGAARDRREARGARRRGRLVRRGRRGGEGDRMGGRRPWPLPASRDGAPLRGRRGRAPDTGAHARADRDLLGAGAGDLRRAGPAAARGRLRRGPGRIEQCAPMARPRHGVPRVLLSVRPVPARPASRRLHRGPGSGRGGRGHPARPGRRRPRAGGDGARCACSCAARSCSCCSPSAPGAARASGVGTPQARRVPGMRLRVVTRRSAPVSSASPSPAPSRARPHDASRGGRSPGRSGRRSRRSAAGRPRRCRNERTASASSVTPPDQKHPVTPSTTVSSAPPP